MSRPPTMRVRFRGKSAALAICGLLATATTASATPTVQLHFFGVSASPLYTDGIRWAAVELTSDVTYLADGRAEKLDIYQPAARGGGARTAQTAAQPVGAATIDKGNIRIMLNELGTVTSLDTVTVLTQINGQLTDVGFNEGQIVKKGQKVTSSTCAVTKGPKLGSSTLEPGTLFKL